MSSVAGFPPIRSPQARALVLGSMPSARSLSLKQNCGHPRNAFWWILGELLGAAGEFPERTARLARSGVALWDALKRCVRPGTLDASIERAGEEPNDLAVFLARHPRIETVLFNGAKAEEA